MHVLRTRYGPDWSEAVRVIYVGDDHTDEDAFRVLKGLGITFRVGTADTPTQARRRFANVAAVEALLRWLSCWQNPKDNKVTPLEKHRKAKHSKS